MIHWIAHYDDGTVLSQDEIKYSDLDRSLLRAFDLWSDTSLKLRLDLRDDGLGRKRLVYRKRSQIQSDGTQSAVYLAGWLRDDGTQGMCYLFEDGSILVAGDWGEEPFMCPVNLQEAEK